MKALIVPAIVAIILTAVACTPIRSPVVKEPASEFGLDIGTPVGLEVQSPACHRTNGHVVATGTLVAEGPIEGHGITVRLSVQRLDGSFAEEVASFGFFPDTPKAGVPFEVSVQAGSDSASVCGIEASWGVRR